MKILKKNQVIIFVIALMLVTAGYLNYTSNNKDEIASTGIVDNEEIAGIGDAKLVSNNDVIEAKEEINNTINSVVENDSMNNTINNNTAISTSSTATKDNYFVTSRLGRDTMYSQMIESYQKILENANVPQEQKAIATQEISKINETKNAIMISENLIKTKGFEDVIMFVNDKSISIIVKGENLEQDKIAQIQNIVARELKAEIENIHISNK